MEGACGPGFTLSSLLAQFEGTAVGAGLAFVLAQDHEARVAALRKAMDFACSELEQNKALKQGCGEDAITVEICSMLKMAGFQATHDEYVNGHCDIVVRGKDLFLWLAEAKEHSDYGWLDKGFLQLSTRYSTGVKGQDHGEVVVYCFNRDARAMLIKWRGELETRHGDVATADSDCGNPLVFLSTHKHEGSGLDFHVRHKALALYWAPEDG